MSSLIASLNTWTSSEGFKSFASSLLAILFGLVIGFVMLLFSNSRYAVSGLMALLSGGFAEGMSSMGDVLYLATPIIMTGLSVGFAFKTGLFNIGGSGQYLVGAFTGIYIGATWTFIPDSILWIVALLGSMIAGAIWAFIPGLLKATRNVNEVITAIMMNYIGVYLVNYLIPLSPIYDSTRNQTVPPRSFIPKAGLDKLFPDSGISAAILIAIACVVIVYIVLNKTTFGYELKACGYNSNAGRYAGINEKKCIILSMVIAGALAGLGGGLAHLANTGKYISVVDVLPQDGFDGIAVALLGLSNPGGIFLAGTFIAYLRQGGFYMQKYGYVTEVINIIIATIIYCSAFSAAFKSFITKAKTNGLKFPSKKEKKVAGEEK
ncbi:MAG: ABC transporter permease [Anaerofustis stercorihominis]|nr:ABC transporter permease [Anaerofustis stercorihominis]